MAKTMRKAKQRRPSSGGATGPKYPVRLLRELGKPDLNDRNRNRKKKRASAEEVTAGGDVYEYDEAIAQEETGKNRRFDNVEKLEYELPSDFEDEEIDEDAAFGDSEEEEHDGGEEPAEHHGNAGDQEDDDDGEDEDDDDDDDERYNRMMQEVTGKSLDLEQEEAEDNVAPAQGDEMITVQDLLAPLQDKPGFNALKKRMRQFERNAAPIAVPLPKNMQDKLDRKAGYELTSKDITKWQHLVRRNREAPTRNFIKREDIALTTTASLAVDFEPKTDFEKEIAGVLKEAGVGEPHEIEAAESLELNKLSVEEVKQRQEKLAKMRHLLFQHELKAKRIKKIKSKTFHRMARKAEKSHADLLLDPEQQQDEAMKQEFKRAQERMTLKHKNTSKWAKRILQRGLHSKEDGTRDAIAEQLRQHSLLTRKVNSATADDSSEDDEENTSESDMEDDQPGLVLEKKRDKKLLAKAKLATLEALEGDKEAEKPTKGLFALPFMVRAMEMKRKEAENEASLALEELEQAEESDGGLTESAPAANVANGRLAFGGFVTKKPAREVDELIERGSDSEQSDDEEPVPVIENRASAKQPGFPAGDVEKMVEASVDHTTAVQGPISISPETTVQQHLSNNPDTTVQGPISISPETARKKRNKRTKKKSKKPESEEDIYAQTTSVIDVNPGIFGNGEVKEPKTSTQVTETTEVVTIAGRPKVASVQADEDVAEDVESEEEAESADEENDDDENGDMDIMKRTQEEWVQEGFADDNVTEFEERKLETIEKEGIKQEKEVNLPGWGQWTNVQLKKGPPAWLLKKRERLNEEKLAATKRRQDAKLKNVIISEKTDKRAAKLLTSSVPFPYTSEEMFERTLRMPIGRDFNTTHAFRELTKPAEIKRPGVIIDPIEYEEPPAKATKRKPGKEAGSNKLKKPRVEPVVAQ